MTESAISLRNVSKKYPIYDSPFGRLKESLRRGRRIYHREFWALREINLEVPAGVSLGILGQNGSGKTTILQLIAGILQPTSGEIAVRGRISTILELGAGFNPDFTGRENATLSGIILGFHPAEIKERMVEIINFAEIGEFIDQPVKTYSSGMYVRLAFAVAITFQPDLLLIDEVLAVGDAYFQHKCMRKIRDFQDRGKTLVYVTHDLESVANICHQAMILDYSHLRALGEPGEIVKEYMALIEMREQERDRTSPPPTGEDDGAGTGLSSYSRYGSKEAEITAIEILDGTGKSRTTFQAGEEFVLKFHVVFHAPVRDFVLGNIFRNRWGFNVFGTNNHWLGKPKPEFSAGERCVVTFRQRADFADGTYSLNPAASAGRGGDLYQTLDWINNAAIIRVRNPRRIEGYVNLPTEIKIEREAEPERAPDRQGVEEDE